MIILMQTKQQTIAKYKTKLGIQGIGIGIFNDNIDVETTTNHDEL